MQTQDTKVSTVTKTPTRLLVDARPVQLQLVEDAAPGKVIMRGEFARCGQATENKRVYPQTLWEREIVRLQKAMENRQLFGESDHPADGRTLLSRCSHVITKLELKDGLVVGEAEILDTAKGRDLKAILESGCRLGISSRGYGSTRSNEKGEEVVQPDYRLVTFDFVSDPADPNAYPQVFYEHKEDEMERTDAELAEEFAKQLEAAKKEGRENAETALREEFAKETLVHLAQLRSQVVEEVRGELLSDPAVAGAKTALEAVKAAIRPFVIPEDARAVAEAKDGEIAKLRNELAEQGLRIKDLEEENQKLGSVAKEAGYRFFVERQIAGDPDAELVRKLLGDVKTYKDAAELKGKLEAVRTDLAQRRVTEQKLVEQIEADKAAGRARKEEERERAVKSVTALREENEQLRLALEKSVQASKVLGLQVYTESRLANHPKASKIRSIVESNRPASKKEVDEIIEKFREPVRDSEELEQVRARVREQTRGGFGSTPLDEETASSPRRGVWNELGVSVAELKQLSGMETTRAAGQGK